MDFDLPITFIKGFAIGLAGAVPLGPLGIICIRSTLQSGFISGVIGGVGTAFADAILAIISVFGLTAIAQFLKDMEVPLRLFGGVFLLAMAWHVFTHKQTEANFQAISAKPLSFMSNFASAFFLTLTNPIAIVFFAGAFASLGIAENQSFLKGCFVVLGVFCGSLCSWVILSGTISLKRNSPILTNMAWINRAIAVLLLLCAIWSFTILLPKISL